MFSDDDDKKAKRYFYKLIFYYQSEIVKKNLIDFFFSVCFSLHCVFAIMFNNSFDCVKISIWCFFFIFYFFLGRDSFFKKFVFDHSMFLPKSTLLIIRIEYYEEYRKFVGKKKKRVCIFRFLNFLFCIIQIKKNLFFFPYSFGGRSTTSKPYLHFKNEKQKANKFLASFLFSKNQRKKKEEINKVDAKQI